LAFHKRRSIFENIFLCFLNKICDKRHFVFWGLTLENIFAILKYMNKVFKKVLIISIIIPAMNGRLSNC